MTSFPNSPRLVKAGIVLMDPRTGAVQRIIVLQYNPETLTRSLRAQSTGSEGGDRSEPLRLTGPPVETYRLTAEIDATDQLEYPHEHPAVVRHGIGPQLAALEMLLYPGSDQLLSNSSWADDGSLEIAPMQAPLTLFVWGARRVLPVRLTEFSVTEQAFDPSLNPLRAEVSLGMRVLSVVDLGFDHKGGVLYMTYHKQLERLASLSPGGTFGDLGLTGGS